MISASISLAAAATLLEAQSISRSCLPVSATLNNLWNRIKDSFLLAVPKKRRSYRAVRIRRGSQDLPLKKNIDTCSYCGSYKLLHTLCPKCFHRWEIWAKAQKRLESSLQNTITKLQMANLPKIFSSSSIHENDNQKRVSLEMTSTFTFPNTHGVKTKTIPMDWKSKLERKALQNSKDEIKLRIRKERIEKRDVVGASSLPELTSKEKLLKILRDSINSSKSIHQLRK